jgi:hypothetical protein
MADIEDRADKTVKRIMDSEPDAWTSRNVYRALMEAYMAGVAQTQLDYSAHYAKATVSW